MTSIDRTRYLDKLLRYVNSPAIVVVTGLRRVGKSVLLRRLAQELQPAGQVLSVDKEDMAFDFIENAQDLVRWVESQATASKQTWVIVDEVQLIREWERAVTSLHGRNGVRVVVSGSNATLLAGELATRLAGRYVSLRVHPLSFSEFTALYEQTQKPPRSRDELFELYRRIGGLPGLLHTDLSSDLVTQMQRDVYHTIALRDIVGRYQIRDVALFEAITRFAMDSVGSLISAHGIARYLKSQGRKASVDTVLNYLRYLCDAYVLEQVTRFDIQGKRHLEVGFKFYLGDIGLRAGLMGVRAQWISGDLENLVFHELLRRGYAVSVGVTGDREIDFVAEKPGIRRYIQVAYLLQSPETIERETRSLLEIPDAHPRIIISMDRSAPADLQGIVHINALDFLAGADGSEGM